MTARATIRPEQIARAKKLLHELPEKDDRKTRPEAARLLENDFRKAMKKGYCPREICALLKNEGILIPAYLIQRFFSETGEAPCPPKREKAPQKTAAPEVATFIAPDTPDEEL